MGISQIAHFASFSIPCLISLLWQDFICISAPLMELNFFDAKWALIVFQPVALPTKMDFSSRICIPCDFFLPNFHCSNVHDLCNEHQNHKVLSCCRGTI